MRKQIIVTDQTPQTKAPLSQAVRVGDLIFLSGQIGLDPETGVLVQGGVTGQAAQCLENIIAVLGSQGLGLSAVVKMTVFLPDMNQFNSLNMVYAQYFTIDPPARSCIGVKDLPMGAAVEMEAIAVAQS